MDRNETTVVQHQRFHPWWIIVLLVLIILAIIAFAWYRSHPNAFGAAHKATPTPRVVTATPLPVTATPRPGPTGTPRPGPTGTPKPAPTATSITGAVKTGQIVHTQAQVLAVQQAANRNQNTWYRNPVSVVQRTLTQYGFQSGQFRVQSPAVSPTPTPFTGSYQGRPEVKVLVGYYGQTYAVYVAQVVQRGPSGIWIVIAIHKGTS